MFTTMERAKKKLSSQKMDCAGVSELLRRSFDMEELPDVVIDKLCDNGTKFVSDILELEIGWNYSDQEEQAPESRPKIPDNMVLKLPTVFDGKQKFSDKWADVEWNKTASNAAEINAFEHSITRRVHNTECYCYELFQMHGNFFEHLTVPKVYSLKQEGSRESGYILMENLRETREEAEFSESMDTKDIYAIVDSLVEMHVFSFLHPEVLGMLDEFPLFAYKFFPFHKNAIINFLESDHNSVYHFPRSKVDSILDFSNIAAMGDRKGVKVWVHGSLWPQNIFVGSEEGGIKPALIDWQMAHRGAPSEDLCRLLTSALSPEMRRQQESEVIEYYVSAIKTSCEAHGISVPFTEEEFLESYMHDFKFCAAILLGQVGMLLKHSYRQETKFKQSQILIRAVAACNDAYNLTKH